MHIEGEGHFLQIISMLVETATTAPRDESKAQKGEKKKSEKSE